MVLCDDQVDRDFERFDRQALQRLRELAVGRTGICDHQPLAGNQQARIYDCRLEEAEGKCRLLAKAYMVRTQGNRDLILEIEGGIKKEVSIGCRVGRAVCSICGKERPCGHQAGQRYGGEVCVFTLQDPQDMYEWSFVAVPAQREAGVVKGYRRRGESQMEQLQKWMSGQGELHLDREESGRLREYLRRLEEDCRESRREAAAKALALMGEAPEAAATLERMSLRELKSWCGLLEGRAGSGALEAPQTAGTPQRGEQIPGDRRFLI